MIINKKDFCLYIEDEYINKDNSIIDSVLNACSEYNVDVSLVEPLINRSIKEKMKIEYERLNYLKNDIVSII